MSDSTIIELLPHSALRYREGIFRISREVGLKGSARFDVRKSDGWPFRVVAGDVWTECNGGVFILEQDGARGSLCSQSAHVLIGYNRKQSWAVEAGEKAIFESGKVVVQRSKP